MKSSLVIPISVLLLLSVVAGAIYANSLRNPFHFDSTARIKNNPAIQIETLSVKTLFDAAFGERSAKDRPIGNITFALNYYVHGDDPFGYHVVNVAIHVLTAFLLYLLIFRTLRLPLLAFDSRPARLISFSTALLWLVHPVNTQSVTYLVQRLNSLAALFYLLAVYLYVEGRHRKPFWPWLTGCVVSWLFALGSKQNAGMLPFFLFLYEWFFFQDLDRRWLRRNLKYALVPVVLFVGVAAVYLGASPIERLMNFRDFSRGEFTLEQRILTQFRVVVFYLGLFVWPHPSRLNLDHDFSLSSSFIDPPSTVLCMGAIVLLLAGAAWTSRRHRLLSFCVFWFFGNLAIESSIIPLAVVFEHRTYLPYTMLSLLPVLGLFLLLRNRAVFLLSIFVPAALFGYWTFQRNRVYADPISLWQDVLAKAPESARALSNLGAAIEKRDGLEAGVPYYEEALRREPDQYETLNNLGRVYYERGEYAEAMALFDHALRANPGFVKALNNKGSIYLMTGRFEDAVEMYRKALSVEPNNLEAEKNIGNALLSLGRDEEALRHLRRAVEIDPEFVDARINLAGVLMQQGKLDPARRHLQRALEIDPDHPNAHNNMGTLLIQSGALDPAEAHFRIALRNDPGFEPARDNLIRLLSMADSPLAKADRLRALIEKQPDNPVLSWELGRLLAGAGHAGEALKLLETALGKDGGFLPALDDAAVLYAQTGDEQRALDHLKKIVEIDPNRADAYYNAACMFSRLERTEQALSWLETAIEKGYRRWDQMTSDPDLEHVRGTEGFENLIRRHR